MVSQDFSIGTFAAVNAKNLLLQQRLTCRHSNDMATCQCQLASIGTLMINEEPQLAKCQTLDAPSKTYFHQK